MTRIYIVLLGVLVYASCKTPRYGYAFVSNRDGNMDFEIFTFRFCIGHMQHYL